MKVNNSPWENPLEPDCWREPPICPYCYEPMGRWIGLFTVGEYECLNPLCPKKWLDYQKGVAKMDKKKEDVISMHHNICLDLTGLYKRKNADYGDSFHKSYLEYGDVMACIRLEDKLNRFKSLTKTGEQKVSDESIDDTLMDLANYAIMTLIERRREKDGDR